MQSNLCQLRLPTTDYRLLTMGLNLTPAGIHAAIIDIIVVVLSITFHEFGHAISADRLGDDLPRRQGRITLLPTEHFDPLGFIMICVLAFGGLGLGWGKPVQVNPGAFRKPRRDMILVAAAGPFCNLVLAVVFGLILRFLPVSMVYDPQGALSLTGEMIQAFLGVNLALMFFNLIPIPPLDGSKILSNLLPFEQSVRYDRVMAQWGIMILLALVFFGGSVLAAMIGPPSYAVSSFLVGPRWPL